MADGSCPEEVEPCIRIHRLFAPKGYSYKDGTFPLQTVFGANENFQPPGSDPSSALDTSFLHKFFHDPMVNLPSNLHLISTEDYLQQKIERAQLGEVNEVSSEDDNEDD
jgi:hypothetical protein